MILPLSGGVKIIRLLQKRFVRKRICGKAHLGPDVVFGRQPECPRLQKELDFLCGNQYKKHLKALLALMLGSDSDIGTQCFSVVLPLPQELIQKH